MMNWSSLEAFQYTIYVYLYIQNEHFHRFNLFKPEIKMQKSPMKATKDPKREKRGKKSHETNMKRLKKDVLKDLYVFL